jgi:hypothetical protein
LEKYFEGAQTVNNYNETDIGDAVRSLVMNILSRELHTAIPGCVSKFYTKGSSRVVDVKPLIRATQVDGAQADLDILQGVLLLTPGTAISSVIMPIAAGDLVLIIVSEKALENWGLSTQPADGIYGRQFDLSDAFAIPMNFGSMSTTENANNADMIIKHNGQTIVLKSAGTIEIGAVDVAGTPNPLAGVVTGECLCAFTGVPHADKSAKVFAEK